MSSTKKDPSFCVAANDPHLVSLGGGRLSTAVTIHNIPIGKWHRQDIQIIITTQLTKRRYREFILTFRVKKHTKPHTYVCTYV